VWFGFILIRLEIPPALGHARAAAHHSPGKSFAQYLAVPDQGFISYGFPMLRIPGIQGRILSTFTDLGSFLSYHFILLFAFRYFDVWWF